MSLFGYLVLNAHKLWHVLFIAKKILQTFSSVFEARKCYLHMIGRHGCYHDVTMMVGMTS